MSNPARVLVTEMVVYRDGDALFRARSCIHGVFQNRYNWTCERFRSRVTARSGAVFSHFALPCETIIYLCYDCFYDSRPPTKPAISLTSILGQSYSVLIVLKTKTWHTITGPKGFPRRRSDTGREPYHGRYVPELVLKPAPKTSLFVGGLS